MMDYLLEIVVIAVLALLLILLLRKFYNWARNRQMEKFWNEVTTYARLHHLDAHLLKEKSLENVRLFVEEQWKHPHLTAEVQIKLGEMKQGIDRLSEWWRLR